MIVKLIKIFWLYLWLSADGKRLFRRLYRMLKDARRLPHYGGLKASINDTLEASQERWLICIKSSDAGFIDFIPGWYIAGSRVKAEQIYYRFFKMGAILLYEHVSLFSAYNIHPDLSARKRCILLAFIKRVYDDLMDNEHIDKNTLFDLNFHPELEDKADYRLLQHLRQKVRQVASPEKFPNYYALLKQVNDAQDKQGGIPYKIKNGFLLDMYIMVNDLPPQLIQAMDLTAEFFAYLDDFYDLDEDLARGKITCINQSQDPKTALKQKFTEAAAFLRQNSPNPDGYLKGIGNLMQNVLFARTQKLNKLSRFI